LDSPTSINEYIYEIRCIYLNINPLLKLSLKVNPCVLTTNIIVNGVDVRNISILRALLSNNTYILNNVLALLSYVVSILCEMAGILFVFVDTHVYVLCSYGSMIKCI
jgi:hypothetical protein